MQTKLQNAPLSRRQFLIRTGWLAGGVTLLTSCQSVIPTLPTLADPEGEDFLLWFQLTSAGKLHFYCPRMEMGQGATAGLTQIVATELNLAQEKVLCLTPSTADLPPFKMTVGSESIYLFHQPVSIGAATFREMLRHRIADELKFSADQLKDAKGGFSTPDGNFVAYTRAIKGDQPLLLNADYQEIGNVSPYFGAAGNTATASNDGWENSALPAIITGKMPYSRDISVPDMVYAGLLRRPAIGAEIASVNWNGVQQVPGIIGAIEKREHRFVALLAESPFLLPDALQQVDVTWSFVNSKSDADQKESPLPSSDWINDPALFENEDFEHVLDEQGDFTAGDSKGLREITSTYWTPYATHAAIEPRAAVASVTETGVTVWCGTQDPYFVRDRIAVLIGRDSEDITVHPQRMGGAFGGRVYCPAAEEAALLSNEINRPVRVQWERSDEFQNVYFQAPYSHRITAAAEADGQVLAWRHDFVSSPIITGLIPDNISWAIDMFVADKGTARGALPPYKFVSHKIRYSDRRTDIPVGAWRGLGATPNAFAIEGMMNELAEATNLDPFDIRLKNLPTEESRLARVLTELRNFCGWETVDRQELKGRTQGMGIAATIYKQQTRVAVAAHVEFDPERENCRILSIWCVQDNGLTVNRDLVENQVMGNVIWGCSMTLKEQLTFENGLSSARNFDSYTPLRHSEAPDIHIKLIDPENSPPSAVGESALPPVPAAISAALQAATGKWHRHLPINADTY